MSLPGRMASLFDVYALKNDDSIQREVICDANESSEAIQNGTLGPCSHPIHVRNKSSTFSDSRLSNYQEKQREVRRSSLDTPSSGSPIATSSLRANRWVYTTKSGIHSPQTPDMPSTILEGTAQSAQERAKAVKSAIESTFPSNRQLRDLMNCMNTLRLLRGLARLIR